MSEITDCVDMALTISGYSEVTCAAYRYWIHRFLRFTSCPPEELELRHFLAYQHSLAARRVSHSAFNQSLAALRYFCRSVLRVPWDVRQLPYQKRIAKLPAVLAPEEVVRLLDATPTLTALAMLATIYSGGLRLREVRLLKINDIDEIRGTIRIEHGKGARGRYVMLSEALRAILRQYLAVRSPKVYLFENPQTGKPYDRTSFQHNFHRACARAGITKRVTLHSLRHSFATHLMENGSHLRRIQMLRCAPCADPTVFSVRSRWQPELSCG